MSIRAVTEIDDLVAIKNVLISVSDKKGLDILVAGLIESCPGLMIYSSGGTYRYLKKFLGEEKSTQHLRAVSQFTGQTETESGLVKTLHHKLFLGYLTETYCLAHQEDLKKANAVPIDLVVINLYPFNQVIKKEGISIEEARGNIDVGGPSALRAAAKNWHRVMCLPYASPKFYKEFITTLQREEGHTHLKMRFTASLISFDVLSRYDKEIYKHFSLINFEESLKCYTIH